MIAHKKQFYSGVGMMVAFMVVLIIIFMPNFNGQNGLNFLDDLYNSISKGSAYYIPKIQKEIDKFRGDRINATLIMVNNKQAQQTAKLFEASGAQAIVEEANLKVTGDLGEILANTLADADAMYRNDGEKVSRKYGYDGKRALFNWWKAFKEMDKNLNKQKKFKEAQVIALVTKKGVEPSYNYYRIEPQKISERWGVVVFSLFFYVFYTLWYGFAIMFIFGGWGMKLGH